MDCEGRDGAGGHGMKRDGEIRNVHLPIQLGVWELLLALTLMGLLNIFNDNGN